MKAAPEALVNLIYDLELLTRNQKFLCYRTFIDMEKYLLFFPEKQNHLFMHRTC